MSDIQDTQCSHNCETCSANCASREGGAPQSFLEQPNKLSSIKKVIGIVSGKGGVGKSLVTSLMAVAISQKGYAAAIMDADITGPSIPKIFGVTGPATGNEMGILPVVSKGGVDIMSVNLLLENDTDPVVVRGPIIAGTVKQFWTDVIWTDVDFMFVDMPPGTGDVPLTVFQSIPVDGIIVVTSPQDLVSMIVSKAVKMAEMMNIPVIGLVENYSYFQCPGCSTVYKIFGDSHIEDIASQHNLPVLAKLPIDPAMAQACDQGRIEDYKTDIMEDACNQVIDFCSK